jgi:hypothetical protein
MRAKRLHGARAAFFLIAMKVYFFMFPVARFQSKTNEKLICHLEHLSIDVVKLRLGLYGWNPRIHQAPVCDMCQNERFPVTEKQLCLRLSRV